MAGLTVSNARPGNVSVGSSSSGSRTGQVFWKGANGRIYLKTANGVQDLGTPQQAQTWNLRLNGAKEISDPVAPKSNNGGGGGRSGSGYAAPAKVLDQAQINSLDSLLASFDTILNQSKHKAALKRDANLREKEEEMKREKGKYEGKKLSTLQEFAGAKTDTDLNTRNTLENLISSLSTLGLGGSRALTRQILGAANIANRKSNATQASNNQSLDTAFNEYTVGNENDRKKIQDQYGYDVGEANRKYYQDRQNALYKKADVFGAADRTGEREAMMREGNNLNNLIAGSAFINPSYTGAVREMKTPELGDYIQDIAKYDTTNIGSTGDAVTPVASDGMNTAGNLAVRAVAVNDKDLGIKKKSEADLGYGV